VSDLPFRPPKPPKRERLVPDPDKIDDAVLALLLLGEHNYQSVWKSFDWDAMDRLHAKGMISEPRSKAKSVTLTDEGRAEAERLFKLLFAKS
jgi:DNA-binding PadR family transcriptional regulator